uniref:Uncharacterized protein n=1 Tax=Branchiostoma floridae TaxID=7739 RepID=C3ZMP7_BRAFL|eukprot:XP_002590143.1 hypothetical protein BRAFLDRAFT_90877 [Branchiostoma floridae]
MSVESVFSVLFVVLSVLLFVAFVPPDVLTTPLDDYVNKPDPHYSYHEVLEWRLKGPGYTMYLLNMTSQQWLSEDDVDRPIWWHFLTVTIPDNMSHPEAAFLYIDDGDNDNPESVSADLKQIPNQPIVFKNDSTQKSRVEDAIIAYTWSHFLDNPDQPDWLLRNPMTKAAVRAMDTVQDFVKKMTGNQPEKFMVAGASKRGWTTWTTAAVDKRVFALAPMVLDVLNLQKDWPRPEMTWARETGTNSGKITLHTNVKPKIIRSFFARTLDGKSRDFRLVHLPPGEMGLQPHPVIWLPEDVQDMGNGTYVAEFDIPAVGWLAFFIQATFPAPHGTALEFTTEVHIIPETFPFPECHGADCKGTLL